MGYNKFAVLGFCLIMINFFIGMFFILDIPFLVSFFAENGLLLYAISFLAFFFSIVGMIQIKRKKEKGKVLAVITLISSVLSIVVLILVSIVMSGFAKV